MTVVYLHPVGLDGRCWRLLPPEATRDAECLDLLWHGDRGRPPLPLTLAALADDVVAQVDGELHLVGLSLGGAVAQEIALRHPERVASLLLACTSARTPNAEVAQARVRRARTAGVEGMLEETLARWFSAEALQTPGHAGVAYVRERLLADSSEAFAAGWQVLASRDRPERLRAVRAPTTVVSAAGDASVSAAASDELVELIEGARAVVVPGPHMAQLECPDTFAAAVAEHREWVAGVLGGTGAR